MSEGVVIWALIGGNWTAPGRDPIPAPPFSGGAIPGPTLLPGPTTYPGA